MRCSQCSKTYANNLTACPFCGAANTPSEESQKEIPIRTFEGRSGKAALFDEWLYTEGTLDGKRFAGHIALERVIGTHIKDGLGWTGSWPVDIETLDGPLSMPIKRSQQGAAMSFLEMVQEQCKKQETYCYRQEGDEEHIIRVRQGIPEEMRRIPQEHWAEPAGRLDYVPVAGIQHHPGVLEAMISGIKRRLELERESDNPVSRDAIKVSGVWYAGKQWNRAQLGYLPEAPTALLSTMWPDAKYGASIQTLFLPRKGKSPGIRINLCIDKEEFKKAELSRPLPDNAEAGFERTNLASSYEKRGEVDKAVRLYQQNIDEQSASPFDFERLSMIHSKRGDLEKALYYCEVALRSPACTNPAQATARRNFTQRRDKLAAKLQARGEKEQR